MKNQMELKQLIYGVILVLLTTLLQGCAVYSPYSFTPLTVPEIVKMSKDKVPSKNIIDEIKKSHTAYTLRATELAKLQKEGVADSVVNYMEKTHLDLIRHNQEVQDSYYWSPGYSPYWYGGLGYGWPYGYWGWNMSPTFIFRGGGGNFHGGGYHRGGHFR